MIMEANHLIPLSSSKPVSGNCFKCRQPGHWMKDCPLLNSPQKRKPTEQQQSDESVKYPTIRCRCGQGNCIISPHKSHPSGVYKCPGDSFRNCEYFLACNQAGSREFNNCHLIVPFPECPCGAGLCTLTTRDNLRCFVCRVPKGQGACNFFQWYEIPPHARIDALGDKANPTNTLPSNLNSGGHVELDQSGASGRKRSRTTEPDPLMEDGYIHLSSSGVTCGPSRTNQLEDRSCHAATGNLVPLSPSGISEPLREIHSDIHLRQTRFTAQISSAETPANDSVNQIAFAPTRCLPFSLPRPFFCCLFPSFDANVNTPPPQADAFVTESSIVPPESPPSASKSKRSEASSPQSPFGVARLFNKVRCDSPTLQSPLNVQSDDVIASSIFGAFKGAALQIQKGLLTRLESMSPAEHETMDKAAHTFFTSLDHLGVDYASFYERVMDYINTAASLAHTEHSVRAVIQSQELTERCRSKELHLEEISRDLDAVMDSLSANEAHRQALLKEIASRDEEAASLDIRLTELYEMKSKSEQDFQAAKEEAEKVKKLQEQREVERRSAVAAFEKAKAQLWA